MKYLAVFAFICSLLACLLEEVEHRRRVRKIEKRKKVNRVLEKEEEWWYD